MNTTRMLDLRPDLRLDLRLDPRLYMTHLLPYMDVTPSLPRDLPCLTSLPQSPRYLTSLRLCLSVSGGEDSLLLPRPWRLLRPVTPYLPT